MPEISRFYGIIIAMFFGDHNPPHFHARYGKHKVAIRIHDFRVLEGQLPPRALGLVIEWAAMHQEELMKNWELAQANQPPERIDPLALGGETMYIDIISATYTGGYRIELTFENGKSGVVDFTKFIAKGGIFSRLSDLNFFKSFQVNHELGVITWDDKIDVAPETLYSEATGEPLPRWMQEETEMRRTA